MAKMNITFSDNPLRGLNYLYRGFLHLQHPQIKPYVTRPIIVSIILYILLFAALFAGGSALLSHLSSELSIWILSFGWLLLLPLGILFLIITFFTFITAVTLIAAPFNSALSEAVEHVKCGNVVVSTTPWSTVMRRALLREIHRYAYTLPRLLLLLGLSLIPFIHALAPLLSMLFSAWIVALQFLDYPFDNHGISFTDMRKSLMKIKLTALGFGFGVSVLLFIPLLNLLLLPTAVVGATLLWCDLDLKSMKE